MAVGEKERALRAWRVDGRERLFSLCLPGTSPRSTSDRTSGAAEAQGPPRSARSPRGGSAPSPTLPSSGHPEPVSTSLDVMLRRRHGVARVRWAQPADCLFAHRRTGRGARVVRYPGLVPSAARTDLSISYTFLLLGRDGSMSTRGRRAPPPRLGRPDPLSFSLVLLGRAPWDCLEHADHPLALVSSDRVGRSLPRKRFLPFFGRSRGRTKRERKAALLLRREDENLPARPLGRRPSLSNRSIPRLEYYFSPLSVDGPTSPIGLSRTSMRASAPPLIRVRRFSHPHAERSSSHSRLNFALEGASRIPSRGTRYCYLAQAVPRGEEIALSTLLVGRGGNRAPSGRAPARCCHPSRAVSSRGLPPMTAPASTRRRSHRRARVHAALRRTPPRSGSSRQCFPAVTLPLSEPGTSSSSSSNQRRSAAVFSAPSGVDPSFRAPL